MAIVSPYKDINQYTRIKVDPHQMNSDIRNNMKLILKKKVEKRCNKNGFVDTVYRIVKYSDGELVTENLSGSAIFDIVYHCRLCIPIEHAQMVVQIKVINQELIVACNGPILIFIPKDNIDTNIWDVVNNYFHKNNKQNLKINDFVKILILDKRINQGDFQIKSIGKLLDFASDEEINEYYGSIVHDDIEEEVEENTNSVETKSNFII